MADACFRKKKLLFLAPRVLIYLKYWTIWLTTGPHWISLFVKWAPCIKIVIIIVIIIIIIVIIIIIIFDAFIIVLLVVFR